MISTWRILVSPQLSGAKAELSLSRGRMLKGCVIRASVWDAALSLQWGFRAGAHLESTAFPQDTCDHHALMAGATGSG